MRYLNHYEKTDSWEYSFGNTANYRDDLIVKSEDNEEYISLFYKDGFMQALETMKVYTHLVDTRHPIIHDKDFWVKRRARKL